MYAVRRWRMERRETGGGRLLVGLCVVMERPEEEKVDGWREGGREGRNGGLDDKRKIQTGQSFLFANRAPDKDSACSGADRGAISLPYSPPPPPLHPSSSLTQQIVCVEEKRKKKKKKRKSEGPYQCSIMVLPSTSHSAAINIAPITVKGTRLGQDDNEHILSSPAEELKYTHTHRR